jgi:hypothetical protein
LLRVAGIGSAKADAASRRVRKREWSFMLG